MNATKALLAYAVLFVWIFDLFRHFHPWGPSDVSMLGKLLSFLPWIAAWLLYSMLPLLCFMVLASLKTTTR